MYWTENFDFQRMSESTLKMSVLLPSLYRNKILSFSYYLYEIALNSVSQAIGEI